MTFVEEHLVAQPGRVRRIFELGGVAFSGRHTGQEHHARCPFHDDHNPSMDVNLDKALFICHVCGASGDAVQFHAKRNGLSDEEASIADLRSVLGLNGGRPEAARPSVVSRKRYEIRSADGTLVAIHERRDLSDGSKTFVWERNGQSGLGGLPVAELPLYGSEHLAEADARVSERLAKADAKATVILTEGEKAADALLKRGYVALGTVTGARGTPGPAALEVLRGHEVVLWPDNDAPGLPHMSRIAAALQGVTSAVQILKWGEREKDDAADFFERGGTEEQLDRLLAEAPGDQRPPTDDAERVPCGFRKPAEVLDAIPCPKFRFQTDIPSLNKAGRGGLPTGIVIVIVGWPDAGKTGLMTQIILCIAIRYEVVVVLFTPDGGQEATAIRIGGLLGLEQDKLEARDPEEKARLAERLRENRIFIVNDSADGMVYERIRAEAERIRPDLPHVYGLDSAQECLATEKADELDERHRAIELMRAVYRTVEANPIPSLAIVTSQAAGQAFTPAKKSDRTPPIGAPAESKKISYLCHMVIALEGDPSREPDFGRARIAKSKLRGPKPSFGLKVDPVTSRLGEIDPVVVEEAQRERKARTRENRVAKIADWIETLLIKAGPLLVEDIRSRITGDKSDITAALDGLEVQGRAAWEPAGKTNRGRRWRATKGPKASDP